MNALRALAAFVARVLGRSDRLSTLPLLDDWCIEHSDPDSGIWAVTPPCGYGFWQLWAPGSSDPAADFHYSGEPYARFPAREGENGEDDLAVIHWWLLPWIEGITGGRIVGLMEGWSALYGPERDTREYVIYAVVTR